MRTEISHSVKRHDCKQGAERDLITIFLRQRKEDCGKESRRRCVFGFIHFFHSHEKAIRTQDLKRCVTASSRLIIAFNVF